jgi:cytoskeletal protein RodZ
MFKILRKKKKGQSTLEFTILIIIIIGALLSIQVYIKRAVQGSLKSAADDISGEQFSPGNTNYSMTTSSHSRTKETNIGGLQTTRMLDNETTNVTTNIEILNTQYEYWG